jgi:hypothetical protein
VSRTITAAEGQQQVSDIPGYTEAVEAAAAKVHEAWMESKREQGVESRLSESGEELMVPYPQLSEAAKDLDRGSVRAVLAAAVPFLAATND